MVSGWFESAATFKRHTREKILFILLSEFDLTVTVVAVAAGFTEINPLMKFLIGMPVLLILVKLVIPVALAWLIPGKLLWPSIIALALVSLWNIKEFLVFFFHG
jgi:hypothetical protein